MNERNRRNHQHSRRPFHNELHSTSSQNPVNHRSIFHGQTPDPSTTTTTTTTTTTNTTITNPSEDNSQSSDECPISICYSYLIAIVSSFLVVLGIYLALTRFTTKYLYISLLGLSIEAFGACFYCLSNIRSSKLARRKQRINSEDFVPGSNSSELGNNNNNLESQLTRQQQINTITHILSNRALTSNVVDNEATDNNNESNPSAIVSDSVVIQGIDQESPTQTHVNDTHIDNSQESTNVENQRNNENLSKTTNHASSTSPEDQTDNSLIVCSTSTTQGSLEQLPKNNRCLQQSPEAESGNFLSSTNLLEGQQTLDVEPVEVNENATNPAQCLAIQQNDISLNEPIQSTSSENLIDITSNSSSLTIVTHPVNKTHTLQSSNSNDLDLINLQHQSNTASIAHSSSVTAAEPQVESRKLKPNQSQRPANIRRTLIMGIGGEEEMIEIDEEDLDNMSILPPSYESVVSTSKNQQIN